MENYKPRLEAPKHGDKYWTNYKHGGYNTCIVINTKDGWTLPNCVGYAHGRTLEIIGKKEVNWKLPACNAEDWLATAKKNGLKTGTEPKLGAVIVWGVGKLKNGADGAGHVAVVEQINDDGTIVTSESGYGASKEFWTKKRDNKTGRWGQNTSYKFLGFIYNPALEEKKPAPVPTPVPVPVTEPDEDFPERLPYGDWYRVRLTYGDPASQVGAYQYKANAINKAKSESKKTGKKYHIYVNGVEVPY